MPFLSTCLPWYSRITAWDYLYIAISLVITLIGLVLFAAGILLNWIIISQLGSVLIATGIVSAFVDKVLHKQMEDSLNKILNEHLSDFTLRDVLRGGGITNIVPSRPDYHGRSIEEFVRTAKHNLVMTGTAFGTALQYEGLQDTLVDIVQQGVEVTVSFVNPDNPQVIYTVARSAGKEPDDVAIDIKGAIARLSKARDSLAEPLKTHFIIKIHDAMPFASGILIDAFGASKKGIIQVEVKPYKSRKSDCFAVETRGSNDYLDNMTLYKTLRESWIKLIEDGRQVP